MRSPSSLIFIVLLGVWAAYFVQYWIRRRDHLATARSVDQFTAAMRVLERRDAAPRTDLSAPAPPSYAVHPRRSARPQVLVKRAVPAETTRRSEVSVPIETAPDPTVSPAAQAQTATPQRSAAHTPGKARLRPSRRVRGLVLLAALLAFLVVVPLVAISILPLWALAPAVLAPVVADLWVRSAVRAERSVARARRRRAGERTRERSGAAAPAKAAATAESDRAHAGRSETVTSEPGVAPSEATSEVPVEGASTEEPDLAEVAVAIDTSPVAVPLVDEDDLPLTWDPVPVPRPTYTMKAKAERPAPAPAATTPEARPVQQDDEAAYEPRRVAGA